MKELLIPVGSWEALEYAVYQGADAVYLGGKRFGARAYANNFTESKLEDAVLFAHLYGVKVYVTVNTMLFERELESVEDYLSFLDKIKVDAVIVSDLGLVSFIHAHYPRLVVHLSTQAHTFFAKQLYFWKSLGVSRVVLDRELSLEEIKALPKIMEFEAFIHGALCVSFSGQCLFSYFSDGRSGNRGTCSQLCRMPYTLYYKGKRVQTEGKYLLSTRELNTSHKMKELMDSPIDSFKVEGRMKSAEYVGFITRFYKKVMKSFEVDSKEEKKLSLLFNRKFTEGYLFNDEVMNFKTSNHQGIVIGKVLEWNKSKIKIRLTDELVQEDGIRFGSEDKGFIVNYLYDDKGNLIHEAKSGDVVFVDNKVGLASKTSVLKTTGKRITQEIQGYDKRKIPIWMKVRASFPELTFWVSDGVNEVVVQKDICEEARNQGVTKEQIIKQFMRVGDTPFEVKNIDVVIDGELFIPVSLMNMVRREGIEVLQERRMNRHED